MKLLFEGYHYKKGTLAKYVNEHYIVPLSQDMEKVDYVGYFLHCDEEEPSNSDVVFILPKVFLDEKSQPFQLEGYKPEQLLDMGAESNQFLKDNGIQGMVFDLSAWIYQAIQFYTERQCNSNTVIPEKIQDVVSRKGEKDTTYLDSILQLKQFYKKHRTMLTYVSIINNTGNNKIHWAKTISHEQPVIRNNKPAYVTFRTKSKSINFDEELIVLFYSVLNYLKDICHFNYELNLQYALLSKRQIRNMIDAGKGTRYLKQIRKKYFVDEFVALYKLLYVFFEKSEAIAARRFHEECVLAKDFQNIFEDMIDYLISDEDFPKELKEQEHGKYLVDHIYRENSLINDSEIYFVGDSKYYPKDRSVDEPSVSKQYMYAKNIIQRNIDVICNFDKDDMKIEAKNRSKYFPYRDDELTKGYNITPNFFISGYVFKDEKKKAYNTNNDCLTNRTENKVLYNRHFRNRLFDRDTLILQHFDINFLYVLTTYAAQQEGARFEFRKKAKLAFRDALTEVINKNYDLYQVCLPQDQVLSDFVRANYYDLAGRIYSFDNILIYAEQKGEADSFVLAEGSMFWLNLQGRKTELHKILLGKEILKEYATEPEGAAVEFSEESFEWPIEFEINKESKFATHLPVYRIKAACGYFDSSFIPGEEEEGWLDVSDCMTHLTKDMFIVYAEGDSMEPKISDGDLCIFERYQGRSRNGEIVLTGCMRRDSEYGCSYTIKKYSSEKAEDENGWHHTSVKLIPLNPDFDPIEIQEDEAGEYKTIGVLKHVIRKNSYE